MMSEFVLLTESDEFEEQGKALAERLGIPMAGSEEKPEKERLYLSLGEGGLSLNQGAMRMQGDFAQMLPRLKNGRLQGELLVKASRLKGLEKTPLAVDATAGMGEDSLLLAAAGYEVWLFEKDPVIAALLEDALKRAVQIPELEEIAGRMHLTGEDSIAFLQSGKMAPDLVYLDPMFPARTKSGLIKKKFQLLQQLESPCSDEEELLQAALFAKPKRIVIKRPAKGPFLAGVKPSYSIEGKAIRYDCLVP